MKLEKYLVVDTEERKQFLNNLSKNHEDWCECQCKVIMSYFLHNKNVIPPAMKASL